MTIVFVLLTLLLLVVLIAWAKLNTLLAFLISSIVGAILPGIPINNDRSRSIILRGRISKNATRFNRSAA